MKYNKTKSIGFALIFFGLIMPLSMNLILNFPHNDNSNYKEKNEHIIDEVTLLKPSYISDSYPTNETLAIIVNMTIWSGVQATVNQYANDLEAAGYDTIIYHMNITNIKTLRNLLKSYYEYNNTVGAVLIGNFPYIWYSDPWPNYYEVFECDLFLMDLDGDWWDTNGDGIYDKHNASSGSDVYPEIYIGRIDASKRNLGSQTNIQNINNLLAQIHSYRIGTSTRTHKALVYIDDDWQGEANGSLDNWPAWLNNAYPNHDDIHTPKSYTNKTDWLTRLNGSNYEFAHLAVHTASAPGGHRFGPNESGSEGNLSANDIHNNGPGFTFYNLYCCRGADYNTTDCMANTYLFSGSYAQSVLGTTKAGGMQNGAFFYDSLAKNNTFGQAFIDWLKSYPSLSDVYSQSWFYGMCILGDPFATIHYDCSVPKPSISSSTHTENVWSQNNINILFNWTHQSDINGIDGSYYILDQNPNTIPTATTGTYTKINGTSFTNLADGIWYLHVVAKDTLGNIGKRGDHFTLKIDTTGPVITLLSPTINYYSPSSSVFISWDAVDEFNSYFLSNVYDCSTCQNIYGFGPNKNVTASSLSAGPHNINITCSDNVLTGNFETLEIMIYVDLINPTVNITNPLVNQTVENTFTIAWQALDGESGIDHTEIYSGTTLIKTIDGTINSSTISGLTAGTHTINVTTYDKSGRSASQTISINVKPGENNIPGFPLGILIIGSSLISIAYIISKKQK
ncbi:MAG: hypothetical protein GF311_18400 [Candidatus Lokiarchaeota archaeon]|nr:hypothetical protein [Candidatus Lokiarchaeota archaeon]